MGLSAWQTWVMNEADRLEDELRLLPPEPPTGVAARQYSAVREAAAAKIAQARESAAPVSMDWLRDRYSGARIEMSWASLHRAEEELLGVQPSVTLLAQIPDLLAGVRANLTPDDPRFDPFTDQLRAIEDDCRPAPRELTPLERAQLRAVRRATNVASDQAHGVVRKWRNVLLAVGSFVSLTVAAVAIVHAAVPSFLPLTNDAGSGAEVWAVETVGAFGGSVAAVLAVNRFSGFADPYGLPFYQALLRIPMAAATALLGAILMQSNVLGALDAQDGKRLLAYSVLFGYAQEPLLRLIDRQAGKVLDPARSKDDPSRPAQHTRSRHDE
ncbi:MAG TPA: hypothetical protein VF545_12915 [Thermoleophilaceae bacterium]|jgi:hypothetical protein